MTTNGTNETEAEDLYAKAEEALKAKNRGEPIAKDDPTAVSTGGWNDFAAKLGPPPEDHEVNLAGATTWRAVAVNAPDHGYRLYEGTHFYDARRVAEADFCGDVSMVETTDIVSPDPTLTSVRRKSGHILIRRTGSGKTHWENFPAHG